MAEPKCLELFSLYLCTVNLTLSVSKSSLKGNDSELLDINGDGKSSVVSSARADWLVAVCHSNHGDMFNKMVIRLEKH